MIQNLWIVEVIYNRAGSLQDPNSPVYRSLNYHSYMIPVIGFNIEEVDKKVREHFAIEKAEFKIIKLISNKCLA